MESRSGKWHFDRAKTRQRCEALERFYQRHGLNADDFRCLFYEQCHASQKSGTIKQYAGGTVGLSAFYDVRYADIPVRILIIGKEASHNPHALYGTASNFYVRSAECRDTIFSTTRTNHIKGTLLTLQRIFGIESDYLYASYALGNALRCAFQKASVAQNTSNLTDTRVMRSNCFPYLAEEIRILEPTLVITQGAWAVDHKPPLVETLAAALGVQPKAVMVNRSNGKYGLYEFPEFMFLTSHHPARLGMWKKYYAPDSLWPMLGYLRSIAYLPTVGAEEASYYEETVKPVIDQMYTNGMLKP